MALLFPNRTRTLRHLVVDAVGVTVVAAGVAAALPARRPTSPT